MIDSQDLDKLWTDDESELKKMLLDMGVDLDQLEKDFENYHPRKPLKYEVMSDDVIEPSYNYPSDSGFDLYSTEEIVLTPFGRALVPTGLKFDIPDGSEIQVRPKSGLAIKQGITVLNTPGTVDSGYNGEIQVIVFNTNPEPFTIQKGMKIAQAVLCPVVNGNWVELIKVDSIEDKDRGDNGFGSTGLGVQI
jgi:dUTP pyrophosphatase